jgi:hypothetical protein
MHRRSLLKVASAAVLTGATAPFAWGEVKPGRWRRLESPHFVFYSAESDKDSRTELIALERFHGVLSKMMPASPREALKLNVYQADTKKDFELADSRKGRNVAGFYSTSLEEVRAVRGPEQGLERQRDMPRNVRALDSRVVLFHEYAHHHMRANANIAYPPWYREGFAEFTGTADFSDTAVQLGKFTMGRARWLAGGDWMEIDKFLAGNPLEMSGEDGAQFYAQAWLAAHYLAQNSPRAQGFDKYCRALQAGGHPLDSFEPAFGISRGNFDKELKDYKRKRLSIWQIPDNPGDIATKITSTQLTAGADDLLMPASFIRSRPMNDEAAAAIAHIRTHAAKHPQDPFASHVLAMSEIWYGDLESARRTLDTLAAADPNSAEVKHFSGLCDLRMAYRTDDATLFKRARSSFVSAHKIDGTRAHSLFRYVECSLMQQTNDPQHLIDVLVAAYNLAPQIDVIALVASQMLMEHERFSEAEAVLRPLVGELHAYGRAEIARTLMNAATSKQTPFAFTFFGSARDAEEG